jgi:hypothetical protein
MYFLLVHGDSGRLSETAKTLLNRLARHFSCITSEQSFYISYALQRLHAVAQKGVARLCRAVQPMPLGVMHLPTQAVMNFLGAPIRQPQGAPLARLNLPPNKPPQLEYCGLAAFSTKTNRSASHSSSFPSCCYGNPFASGDCIPCHGPAFCTAPCIAF